MESDFKPPYVKLVYDTDKITDLITNIILIHDQVGNYNEFVDGCNPTTFPIVYNYTSTKTELTEVLNKFNKINRIAVVCHGDSSCRFLDMESLFSESNTNFFIEISKNITNLDFLACNTLQYDTWNTFYDALKKDTSVIIGASNDETGNLKQGGDWILESTKEDIVNVYFTDKIENYQDTLATYNYTSSNPGDLGVTYTYDTTTRTASVIGPNTLVLANMNIPSTITVGGTQYTVTSIVYYAFRNCSGLTGSLTIPVGVISIGNGAFINCSELNGSLTIPNTVTSIGEGAFSNCSELTGDLTIPVGVESIGDYAFLDCSGLNGTLTIPNTVTSIGYSTFRDCSALTGDLTIPEGVTSIGDYAFANCSELTGDLTIPVGVESIGNYAFTRCLGLTGNLTIPSSVKSIGDYAFYICSGLTQVIFNGVIEIGSKAFRGCIFTSVDLLPDSAYVSTDEVDESGESVNSFDSTVIINFICFNKGTTILCLNAELIDEYIPVESLKVGDLVKTYKHGYRRIAVMLSYHMRNDSTRFGKSLHRMKKTDTMTADLILTGWHSILVDDLGDYETENTKRFGEVQIIDDKYLLLCAISRDFTMLEDTDDHSVYHFCLDGDGNETARYGVYANGVLCETPSIAMINKKS
jgi:hypothetical protein